MPQVLVQIKKNINNKNKNIVNAENYLNDLTKDSQNYLSKDVDYDNNIKNINLIFLSIGIQNSKSLNIIEDSCSEKQIAHIYEKDELV